MRACWARRRTWAMTARAALFAPDGAIPSGKPSGAAALFDAAVVDQLSSPVATTTRHVPKRATSARMRMVVRFMGSIPLWAHGQRHPPFDPQCGDYRSCRRGLVGVEIAPSETAAGIPLRQDRPTPIGVARGYSSKTTGLADPSRRSASSTADRVAAEVRHAAS